MSLPAIVHSAATPVLTLAPMATLSHAALRSLIHDFGGCDLYFSEMVSAEAHLGGTPFERYYSEGAPDPGRLVYQLIGKRQETLIEAARRFGRLPCAGVDLNFGCSAPHIRKAGGGIAWTADVDRAARLVDAVRRAVPADRTVSVKLRLADTGEPQHTVRLAQMLARAGADFLTLHPRRMSDSYSRPARRGLLEVFARELDLPLIGNGDVLTAEDVAAVRRTGATGVMIGRGAVAHPWLFARLKGIAPADIDRGAVAQRFHELLRQWQPAEFLLSRVRRFHHYFLASFPFGSRVAAQVQGLKSFEAVVGHVEDYFARFPRYRYVSQGSDRGGSTVSAIDAAWAGQAAVSLQPHEALIEHQRPARILPAGRVVPFDVRLNQ